MRFLAPLVALAVAGTPSPLPSQGAAEHIHLGDSATTALQPDVALRHYQAALTVDSTNYEANWKAARAIADVAKQIEGNADSLKTRRDSLYSVGRGYAERAVRVDSLGADGHYALAMVLGRLSRTKGSKERVRFAKLIFDEATRAIALNPNHDGAHHVLGAWHAEVKRLSFIQRTAARLLFGGGFMGVANWDDAVKNLERAVALNPRHIYHRLELAEVYADIGQYSKAREQLTVIPTLPIGDVLDAQYKEDAAALLEDIKSEKDQT
ncbi:MAG TPA: tetratricopeptide repeat protein [Gemmatimonadales bacterium]|jgi:tetratricopeptide (TPR) repeat protein|nr:tetratricopeptide repeat protein [Gemmatimonadales bacterium]